MELKYYKDQLKQLVDMTNMASEKKISFLQHVLLVSASILGVIISLHTTNSQFIYIRLVFFASTAFLLLGTLSLALVLYDFSVLPERCRESFRKEVQDALQKDRECNLVTVPHKKRTLFLEKASYIFLTLGLILLVTYNGLSTFEQKKEDNKIIKKEIIIEKKNIIVDSLTTKQKTKKHE